MKRKILIFILDFLPLLSFSQVNVEWITHFGGSTINYGTELGRKIITDVEGNVYVAGEFSDTILIDTKQLISRGNKDIFLTKIDPTGRVLWMKDFGGIQADWCGGVCIDENSNIFLTGTFRGEMVIGDSIFNSTSWYDIFLSKINKNGEIIWSKAFIGDGGNSTNAITKDSDGYIYLTGHYQKKLSFDNYQLEGPTARSDLFVVKLNANGNVIWAKSTKSNANNYGNSIASDNIGHLYLTGFMWDSVYFDDHLLVSTSMMQAYISKMDAINGKFLWAVGGGGDGWSEGTAVVIDNNKNAVLTGWYRDKLIFSKDFVSNGGNTEGPDDIFISKFDSLGNPVWIKTTMTNLYSNAYDVWINDNNDIFLTGYYRGLLMIEDSIYQSTVPDYYDICVIKFNKNGKFKWFKSFGGDSPWNDIGYGITSYNNNIFVTGMYSANSWFDNNHLSCNGVSDIYILKISDLTDLNINVEKQDEEISIYPNPCSKNIFVKFKNNDLLNYQLRLFNSLSIEILREKIVNENIINIELSNYPSGIYILQIQNLKNSIIINKKIVKNN